ncbi:class I SAM-dependent methyltransferase [Agathobaculum sp. NTUH-O15-33]|uniref:class I SAM-dependent methyltransferase n=1 Tax=Agathobaculum sp. NTUH-O15-33 TaxID=3079302 RepID=UPI002958A155|nr:class I SAM-dependent methyltransferase [Agathobaculum sp. NTUH-O15-33]WNX86344.1 class I SAM-dependent methyltransferase [Agathobaculum sp. NTUH-O15-33]
MQRNDIDAGRAFDWGRASADYAKYRDIYPAAFYQKIRDLGLCGPGQRVLDLGTGTGVLPRHLYPYGAVFTGTDISERQISMAKALARDAGMEIDFRCMPAEQLSFPEGTFDVVTACQCFVYFDHDLLAPRLSRLLARPGRFAVLYMAWLPEEDDVAAASEKLILQYNPVWTGCGETRRPIEVPAVYRQYFEVEREELFDLSVPFTRESWNGRIKACRGIEASLSEDEVRRFDGEHRALLARIAPPRFDIRHYAAITVLRAKPA